MKIIEVERLTKIYKQANSELIIFENLSFSFNKGEFISIVGPSGSGKSTLLNLISTVDSKYTGTIKVFGQELSKLNENQKNKMRLKNIGFIFQFDSLLEDLSAIENIELPSYILTGKKNPKKAFELMKKFNIEHLAYKTPDELSGGEKQRISILRAITNNPDIIIADEPTGNLDWENAVMVMKDFKKLNKEGKTIIMVTHNIELARSYSDKTYLITKSELKIV